MLYKWLGLQDYNSIYEEQKKSIQWSDQHEEVWGLEHPNVITLGRRSQMEIELSVPPLHPVVSIDRGGLATMHNPGQLVIYPLISLKKRDLRPKDYVCELINITKSCLAKYGLIAQVDDSQSGLFVNGNKICFVGLRIKDGRAYHGLALNVNNSLEVFGQIRSCGMQNRPTTNLRELGADLDVEKVFFDWCEEAKSRGSFGSMRPSSQCADNSRQS